MRSGVPFEIEGVVETFAAEGAEIPFGVRMAFHVPVQQSLKTEHLVAEPTLKL